MRQVLIVDSLADQRFRPLFEKVFFTVGVGTVWNDYETIGSGNPAAEKFKKEVRASDALFLILSQEVQSLSKARNWIFGDPAFAGGGDVWVFEHCEDLKRITVSIPALRNFASFYITNAWTDYFVKIAGTFEASKAPPASLPQAQLETLTPAATRVFFNDSTGMALFDHSTSRPMGVRTACPHCEAAYMVHMPSDMKVFRCPVCHSFFGVKWTANEPLPSAG